MIINVIEIKIITTAVCIQLLDRPLDGTICLLARWRHEGKLELHALSQIFNCKFKVLTVRFTTRQKYLEKCCSPMLSA